MYTYEWKTFEQAQLPTCSLAICLVTKGFICCWHAQVKPIRNLNGHCIGPYQTFWFRVYGIDLKSRMLWFCRSSPSAT
jgi:hypothetical protein